MVGIEPTQKGPGSLFYLKYPEPLSRNAAVMLFIRFASITGKMSASVLYYLWDGLFTLHPLVCTVAHCTGTSPVDYYRNVDFLQAVDFQP